MNIFKLILYFILAFILVRFLMRMMYPTVKKGNPNPQQNRTNSTDNLEKPTFKIEAESVDYEIIDEPKKKNEE